MNSPNWEVLIHSRSFVQIPVSLQQVFGIFGCVDSVVCVKRKAGLEESGGVRRYAAPARLNPLAWPEIAELRSSDHEIRSGQLSGQRAPQSTDLITHV